MSALSAEDIMVYWLPGYPEPRAVAVNCKTRLAVVDVAGHSSRVSEERAIQQLREVDAALVEWAEMRGIEETAPLAPVARCSYSGVARCAVCLAVVGQGELVQFYDDEVVHANACEDELTSEAVSP